MHNGLPPHDPYLPFGVTQRDLDRACDEGGAPERDCCGCCARDCWGLWCDDCVLHVLTRGPLWDRTYFAQFGLPCPFLEECS